ncbi:O-Antigen ligase [Novipirellula galeiformis]|uniref:O-Antigen ligase n=1 Tax=Novipirellula galeiformis TaxID=2528004 RepID=A0A5C6CCL4_9BACT|nr:O-antigen ligase family protein [Novipirellula galeiformis]TWU21211.1 O-Antigen ligase [Novipirellula galeiformis]
MLGPLFVYCLLGIVCIVAFFKPAIGVIGFYGFVLLDPGWNWRWSLEQGTPYQKYIFVCLALAFALRGFRTQRFAKLAKFGVVALLFFLGLCFVSAQQSIAPAATEFFMSYAWKVVLVVVLAICVLDNPKHITTLLIVAVLAQAYNAYQINLEYFQLGISRYAQRPWGSMGVDNNGYSIITVPVLAASFALGLWEQMGWKKFLYLGISLLQIHQIMLLESRGCMIAAVLLAMIAIWYMPRRDGNVRLIAAVAVMTVLLAGPSVVAEFSSSFASKDERDSSAESRFYLWQAGYRITMDYPVFGVGPNAARSLVPLPEYYDGGLDLNNKALHNLFFDVSTGMGIPAALIYFSFLLVPVVYCWRTYRRHDDRSDLGAARLAVVAGMPAYLLASMFSSGVLFESCYILAIVGYCTMNIDLANADSESEDLDAEENDDNVPDLVA